MVGATQPQATVWKETHFWMAEISAPKVERREAVSRREMWVRMEANVFWYINHRRSEAGDKSRGFHQEPRDDRLLTKNP